MFAALKTATSENATPEDWRTAHEAMNIYFTLVRSDVDDYRRSLLGLIEEQEREVLEQVDRSYNQIHYANSVVTGHLASIVKVHDAQEEVLNAIGVEGLRGTIGQGVANLAHGVSDIVDRAGAINAGLGGATDTITDLKSELKAIVDHN